MMCFGVPIDSRDMSVFVFIAHSDTLKRELLQHYPEISADEIFVAHDAVKLIAIIENIYMSATSRKLLFFHESIKNFLKSNL